MAPIHSAHSCTEWYQTSRLDTQDDNNSRPPCIIPLTLQLGIPATKVPNTSLQQIMLKQVTDGYRKTRTLDGGEVYLYAIIVQIIFNLEILFSLIFED